MAFIAIAEATGRMLGVVRLHDDPNGDGGEFAILVRSHLKGHGLGWLMMKHMIAYAQEKGLKTVHGQVLAENATMLQMCARAGLPRRRRPGRTRRESRHAAAATNCRRSPLTERSLRQRALRDEARARARRRRRARAMRTA